MATRRKPAGKPAAKRKSERGSTLYGVLAGLLIGLVVAAGVAFYVTRAPVPFVDRATREADQKSLPDVRTAPDPNVGLYGRDGAAGTAPSGPTATTPAPAPGAQSNPRAAPAQNPDDLGALIATLPSNDTLAARSGAGPSTAQSAEKAADKPRDKPADKPAAEKPAAKPPAAVASAAPTASSKDAKTGKDTYFLQAGAYRSSDEAEAMKARIIMLGLPVAVQRAEVNGKPLNRVRVGPFSKLDDMNRARARLGESKIEVAVMRQ
ncbi:MULTISPECIES: SPOR domain-containing protein [unclassified Achromobacter]|uniref:SPOR domain-containing protein n=1 Tax=unclassified Achromobacter TaxID=2626865 RepID=UPI000B518214|nr:MULTISPECIES: SPOR domain-containing protein [unclassified Achromobacter]OWT74388.1 cell division protein [Achromobacter sp. HZ34]OWT78855.1 cell division protein [Achromobacter sp. HZ28]